MNLLKKRCAYDTFQGTLMPMITIWFPLPEFGEAFLSLDDIWMLSLNKPMHTFLISISMNGNRTHASCIVFGVSFALFIYMRRIVAVDVFCGCVSGCIISCALSGLFHGEIHVESKFKLRQIRDKILDDFLCLILNRLLVLKPTYWGV